MNRGVEPGKSITLTGQHEAGDYEVEATRMNMMGRDDTMVIMLPGGPLYVTREQAKNFFGFMEDEFYCGI